MSLHLAAYLAGTPYFVGARYRPGGKRVRVFDRTRIWRNTALALVRAGKSPEQVARILRRPRATVERVLSPLWAPSSGRWIKSNLSLAQWDNFPL